MAKKKAADTEPADTVEVVLLDANRLIGETLTIPASDLTAHLFVNGARWEHVDEDEQGRWRFVQS